MSVLITSLTKLTKAASRSESLFGSQSENPAYCIMAVETNLQKGEAAGHAACQSERREGEDAGAPAGAPRQEAEREKKKSLLNIKEELESESPYRLPRGSGYTCDDLSFCFQP